MKIDSPQVILHELESLRQMGSVLYIAAHPDDENTELLAYLALGRKYRTAYLSLTRGDGGQNVLSADMGEKLGVARTQELLVARQIDGAKQYFSRAIDFGFSKDYQETLKAWDKQEVLSDMVRVIRTFRPDVLITRFSPSPGGTHGHHTTSTVLALEAFKLAGDSKAFPEQKLAPWQPKRILWNTSIWQKEKIANTPILKIESTGKDSITGETFHEIASQSRAMHKTQGFDSYRIPGVAGEKRYESFQQLNDEKPLKDIMDDVDTSWNRVKDGTEIEKSISDIISNFDSKDPAASLPPLLKLRSQLSALPEKDSVIKEKQIQLDTILQGCLGLKTVAGISHSDVVPGESVKFHVSSTLHSKVPDSVSVKWISVRFPTLNKEIRRGVELKHNEPSAFDTVEVLPETTPLTQPYWLRADSTPGMFHVDDPNLIGTAENTPSLPLEYVFDIAGQTLVIHDEPLQVTTDSMGTETRRRLDVIPPVSLRFTSDVVVMTPGTSRSVEVEIKTARANSLGTLSLEAPTGWKIEPAKQKFDLATIGQSAKFTFSVTAPQKSETTKITASAEMHGVKFHNQRQEISYGHIPRQLIQPPAVVKAVSLKLVIKGKTIGYLPGAGDTLPENLQQMGYAVKVLDDANLTAKQLEGIDAVVLGVRAFNVRNKIGDAMPTLFTYVENGGTVIVQYNRPDKLKAEKITPYDLHISPDRVTDEKATMTFLAPDNAVLNVPNKISLADFDGWVQERGLYFPNQWDAHFTPVLACNDTGEAPTKGVLLVAKYGKGHYIYTGLSFFRQLPAGVPGAYRLFANMVSIGK
ncbi:MAG: PIG-L family deacetylase [Leptolyngbya sp.]|nr:PIG-L family deacetylase [Candidatus Melainabacteria bacterium]